MLSEYVMCRRSQSLRRGADCRSMHRRDVDGRRRHDPKRLSCLNLDRQGRACFVRLLSSWRREPQAGAPMRQTVREKA